MESTKIRLRKLIQEQFSRQAYTFGQVASQLARVDLLEWSAADLSLTTELEVLDVGCATGLFARSLAPRVRRVTALDAVPEMIEAGRKAAAAEGLSNIRFVQGFAEELPFPDASFDAVVSRVAIHHFVDPAAALGEMARVTRPGGRVAAVDLYAPDDPKHAETYNAWERARDPSHHRALPTGELVARMETAGISAIRVRTRDVELGVMGWLDSSGPAESERMRILEALERELNGGAKTGLRPLRRGDELFFVQNWVAATGVRLAPH